MVQAINSVKLSQPFGPCKNLQPGDIAVLYPRQRPDAAVIVCPRPIKGHDDGIDRILLYVAMTRAEDMLAIPHSSRSSYVEELDRALGTVPR
jgi:hypothetical protein